MKVVEGQLPAIESKHSRTQADRRTFLKTVGASAVSVVGANAAFAEAAPESRQAAAESHPAEKPKPISSGPSQAEGIVEFAPRARYEDLTPGRRERLKVSVLDSLACAINALAPFGQHRCNPCRLRARGQIGSGVPDHAGGGLRSPVDIDWLGSFHGRRVRPDDGAFFFHCSRSIQGACTGRGSFSGGSRNLRGQRLATLGRANHSKGNQGRVLGNVVRARASVEER
jgi:hypothetical protein